ncbi:MAG: tetratricopeptide repeat protein, partial [Fuerstiella sp.]|nr:tetratricopeptide repeat protein [Fuerstiella sp.]
MRVFVGVCVITALLVGTLIVYRGFKPSQASRLKEASVACERKDFGEALRLCELVLQTEPDSHDARFIGGRAARELKLYHTALKHLRKIELNDSTEAVEAQFLCGNISLQLFRLTDAERYLRQALEQDPEHVEANANMVFVLRLEGRNQEAVHHVHQLLRHGRFESDYLSVAGTLEATWIDPARDVPFLNACRSARPNDPVWALGLIRRQISEHEDLENAVQSLQAMVRQTPELLQAQATLGQLLLEIGAHDDWLE